MQIAINFRKLNLQMDKLDCGADELFGLLSLLTYLQNIQLLGIFIHRESVLTSISLKEENRWSD